MKQFIQKVKGKKNVLIENNFFRPRWYSIFLNPYYINRNGLYVAIRQFAKGVPPDARILDVGCGLKPYRSLFTTTTYTGIDIQGGGHTDQAKTVDAFYDGLHIPFENTAFDVILCTQVLEHAEDPEILVREMARVLRPGGMVFISMPFIYPEHEIPFDFRRFTRFEHMRLLKKNGFSNIEIVKTTGLFGTFGQLLSLSIFEGIHFRSSIFKTVLSIFILAPIQICSLLLDTISGKSGSTMDYVITAQKI